MEKKRKRILSFIMTFLLLFSNVFNLGNVIRVLAADGAITIAEARKSQVGTTVTVQGVVTRKSGKNYFLKDGTVTSD